MVYAAVVDNLKHRWRGQSGYRELLVVALPLILSTGSWSVQHFVDRVFLTWHSSEAVAATMPAGIVNFAVISLFLGTASYVSTFVSQYYGAGRWARIGPAVWQGMYVSAIGWVVILATIPLAGPFFALIGHGPLIQRYETVYFQILCIGSGPALAASAMSGFFSGRGRTWPVMWVSIAATAVNLVADYGLIFGKWGLPALGVAGAAIATCLSGFFSLAAYLVMLGGRKFNRRFRTISGWRFDRELFKRLIRYGFPNGMQFFLDIVGFTVFILLVGRLGTVSLAATNIAMNINTLAFMPMIGLGIAVSVLVGRYVAADQIYLAEKAAWSGFHLTLTYMVSIAAMYVLAPGWFLAPFASQADPESFAPIRRIVVVLLRFVAVYSLFDGMNIVFASAIKGAGDTRYVMFMIVTLSTTVLGVPTAVALIVFGAGLYVAWVFMSAYVIILAFAFLLRFLGGKWKSMRVIEEAPPAMPVGLPAAPTVDVEP